MHDLPDDRSLAMILAVQLHHEQFTNSTDFATARDVVRATASSFRSWLTAPDPDPAIAALTERITALEDRMTAFGEQTDAKIEELRVAVNDATNRVATELQELRDQLGTTDQATAEALTPIIAQLNAIGADPANPVPSPESEPIPEPVPGEPTPEQPL